MSSYIKGLFHGLGTLLTGLKVTGREFFTPKITEQYPENRATLKMYDRFCGSLTMPHDAEGKNKCVACGLCLPDRRDPLLDRFRARRLHARKARQTTQ